MGARTGYADLPLHGGQVPAWLASRMARLGRVVVEALILHYGRQEVLRRLSHPFWFQSLGCVMGMDWHSSGITTSVVGALKRGLAPVADELGLWICGGRGKHSRATPDELRAVAERTGLDGASLAQTSRLVAKVDNTALQDGFQIYLHAFVVAADGAWTVVQQGMDPAGGLARRYHWLSEGLRSFVDEPHAAIAGPQRQRPLVNLTDHRAEPAREALPGLLAQGPDTLLTQHREARRLPHLTMPGHHDVRAGDIDERRLHGTLAAACAANASDFQGILLTPGLGPRTLEALALVSEVIHGRPTRFADPARFSLAHGGKDGHPFPVPVKVYDETLRVMRAAVDAARLGQDDKLAALKRLDDEARRLESVASGEGALAYMAHERRMSPHYGGRTVFGPARAPAESPPRREAPRPQAQPRLPGL